MKTWLLTDTVVDPGAVVVELGDTLVTHRAVFGADGAADDTRTTELVQVQRLGFGQLQDRLRAQGHGQSD